MRILVSAVIRTASPVVTIGVGVDHSGVGEVLVDGIGGSVVDVAGAGSIDSEVEEGRAVGGPADVVGGLAAVSDQGGVDALLAVEPRVAGGSVIDEEVAVLADVALRSRISAELAARCAYAAGASGAGDDVLSESSARSVQFSLVAVVVAPGGVVGLLVGLLPEVVSGRTGSASVVVFVRTSQAVFVAEVAHVGQSSVCWSGGSEWVGSV